MLFYLAPGWVYQLTALLPTAGCSYHPFSPLLFIKKSGFLFCDTVHQMGKPHLPCVSTGTNPVRSPDFPHELRIHAVARLSRIYFKSQMIIIILAIIPKNVHGPVIENAAPVNIVLNLRTARIITTFTQSASLSTGRNPRITITGITILNNSSERQRPSKK